MGLKLFEGIKDTSHHTLSDYLNGATYAPEGYTMTLRSSIDLNNWSGRHATHDINDIYSVIQSLI